MRIILTNLSNELYEESRIRLNMSAEKYGIIETNSYDFADITTTKFYSENKKILDSPKGIGYWLWKPFIILETMKRLEEGDIVIYSDCGIEIISDLKPLINICKLKEPVLLFANGNFANSLWAKKDCFCLMDCDTDEARISRHCDAAFALFRKCDFTIEFLSDWLFYGANENIISDLPNEYGENSFEYIDHRWDQSILSLLAYKRNIELYRMPTQFGNYYKVPAYRVNGEIKFVNQLDRIPTINYSKEPYENSCYFQLLNHHRDKKISHKVGTKENKSSMISSYIKKLFSISFVRKIPLVLLSKLGFRVRQHLVKENFSNSFRKSYSQCGEDLIIEYIFYLRGISKPSFLDIGANDPFVINNTALFYQLGSNGVNIEANPDLINKLNNCRPRDITLNVGIGLIETEMNFYIMEDHTLSTFSESEYLQMLKSGKTLFKIKRVQVLTLNSIVNKYFSGIFPDLLCIDVEGLDFDILKSLNFEKSAPKVICVEAAEYSPIGAGKRRNELITFLEEHGYHEYANTNLNAIMVKNEFWFI